MILTNANIDHVTVNRTEYTFVNMSPDEVYGWKRLLQALDGAGHVYEIEHSDSYIESVWCRLTNLEITIHVHGKNDYSVEYHTKDGASCDWDIGGLRRLKNFLNAYPNHPACE